MIIVDIDGTIAEVGDRLDCLKGKDWDTFYERCDEDKPIQEIIDLVSALHNAGEIIVFCTGRRESVRHKTIFWIKDHFPENFDYHALLMRGDRDYRHDTEMKFEAIEKSGIKIEDIKMVFEDRDSMVNAWRSRGVRCLQVADGAF